MGVWGRMPLRSHPLFLLHTDGVAAAQPLPLLCAICRPLAANDGGKTLYRVA
nr:MAG TPA: hypothetical protein [Caudoviricetes sp.]